MSNLDADASRKSLERKLSAIGSLLIILLCLLCVSVFLGPPTYFLYGLVATSQRQTAMFATHAVIRATSSAEEIAFTTLIDNYMNAMAKRNTDQALTLFADHQSSLENLNALVSGENYAWFDSYTEV